MYTRSTINIFSLVVITACSSSPQKNTSPTSTTLRTTTSPSNKMTAAASIPKTSEVPVRQSSKPTDNGLKRNGKSKGKNSLYERQIVQATGTDSLRTFRDWNEFANGFDYIIRNEQNPEVKAKYSISQGAAQIELVRQVRLKLIAATEEQETASLSKAQISLNNAVQLSKDPKIKSQALFLIGLIGVYQNNSNLALMSFRDASNLDRTNPNYDQMQFYVAEIYFDRNQYKEAIGTYTEASQSKNAKLAILARYKLAWCHINQSQYDPAKKLLSGIIMSNLDANFREDALKDLAFLVTLYKSEQEIVDYANKEFPLLVSDKKQNEANEAKVAFLNNVYQILLSQGTNTDRPLILREILAWEKRPEYRIVTLTVNLKVHQRDFATHRASYDFDQILKELNQIKNPRDKNVSDIYSKVLEPELKRVANSYWNTYQKKVKSPEVIPDDVLIKRLNHFLDVYIYYFPESDSIIESMLLRMQICEKLNDPMCVYKSAKQALTVDSLKKDFYKFRYALVGALAELNKSHPNYKSEYIRTNFEFLLGSTDEPNIKLPNSVTPDDVRKYLPPTEKVLIGRNEWLQVAKAFITILHNNREYSLAEPLIQKVVEMEGSAENQYRLTFNRYNQHKYILISQTKFSSESLSGDKELKEMVTSSLLNVINWKRSSLLGSLQPGQSSNTGPSQEDISALNSLSLNNLVQQFYDLKPKREDQLKVAAMVINLQLDDKSAATATTSSPFGNLTHQEKMSQNIFPTWKKYVLKLFQDGQFQTAYSELTPCAHHKDCPLILDGFYEAALALKKESSPEVISKLTETKDIANAELILDRLMLIDADGFQNFLNSLNKISLFQASVKRFSRMKTMIDDANKLQQAPVDLSLDASKENDLLFAGYSPPPKSIFAKQIQLRFPNSSTPKQKIENILKGNINDVRFLRKKSVKAVQSLSYVDSVHLLRISAMNEKRLAQSILASPVPDSLAGEQIKEYQAGLENLAKEFSDQALVFEESLHQLTKSREQESAKYLDFINTDLAKWILPEFEKSPMVMNDIKSRQFREASAKLDLHTRYFNLNAQTFLTWLTYLQLSANKTPGSVKYLSEVIQKNHPQLLENWKKWR